MTTDRFGMATSTANDAALRDFEEATFAIAAHKPGVADSLARALEKEPQFVAAHALLGFANVLLARVETISIGRDCLARARRALASAGGSEGERAMVDALALSVSGGLNAGADRLDAHLVDHPECFIAAKLAHSLRFMSGDALGMLTSVDRTLVALPKDHPGHGFTLGCRAFALEELGAYDAAERLGREAVDFEPEDSWAIHAIGHVHEMTGRAADGLTWIESRRATWTHCNNFALHMSWHAALFQLELGRIAHVLDLYDREIWPSASDDFRDMSNAVALLARVEQFGVDVGRRWAGPAEIAARRAKDTTLTFAALHNLVALVASGNLAEARELALALEAPGAKGDDQEEVRARVGRPLARAMLDMAGKKAAPIDFARVLRDLPKIGGSNAQRDVFTRQLARMAAERRDAAALETVLAARRTLKREDSFVALTRARFQAAETRDEAPVAATSAIRLTA